MTVTATHTAVTAAAHARASAGRVWDPADGVAVRGTVVVLPGRGEHAGVYERFGHRLAFDGYAVRALDEASAAGLAGATLGGLYHDATRPIVLAGADAGAVRALAIAAGGSLPIDGLLLAGTLAEPGATRSTSGPREWEDELDARTACPVHRARLSRDTTLVRGALSGPVPVEVLDASHRLDPRSIEAPTLLVHGDADVIAPVAAARALATALPRGEIAIVRGGRHDVLNDAHHRTVAAHVVQWLERIRTDTVTAAPILTVS